MPTTTGSTDIELTAADGTTVIPLMLVGAFDNDGNALPKTLRETLSAAVADSPLSEWLEAVVQEDWSGGIGISYNQAPVYTRTPGYAMPAGAVLTSSAPTGNSNNSPYVAFGEIGTILVAAQEGNATFGGRVMTSAAGGGTWAVSLSALGAGEYIRDLLSFDDGAGTQYIYASSSDINGLNGRLHRWDGTGASWSASVPPAADSTPAGRFGTNGRNRMTKVFWRTPDGAGAWRMVTVSGKNTIAYTLPNADPFLAASWVEGVKIMTAYSLTDFATSRSHIFLGAQDNVFDIDGQGNTPGLMSYVKPMTGNGVAIQYHDGYVYYSVGQGLERVRVDRDGVIQENPGQCAPGWGTRAENDVRGYITAMMADMGYLVAAVYNESTQKSYICWGKDRTILGIESPNPLIWYGPEVICGSTHKVTRLHSSTLAGDLRLWVGSLASGGGSGFLTSISLPIAGNPIQDLLSGGSHKFADGAGSLFQVYSRLESLGETLGDKSALKFVHQHSYGTRGLGGGTKLTVYDRADPAPGSTSWGSGTDVTVSPVTDLTPSVVVSGNKLEHRIDFISPSGASTPPVAAVLDSRRSTLWRNVPTFRVLQLDVEYGDSVTGLDGGSDDSKSPTAIKTLLKGLTQAGKTTLRMPDDSRWTVKLRQALDSEETVWSDGSGTYGKTVQSRLVLAVVAGPL